MSNSYEVFDAARLQLTTGVNLVEASAGTGKTYAIGMLVLRTLVELEIPIEKILIVTFTKAATEELQSRIRSRLVEAKELFAPKNTEAEVGCDLPLFDWVATVRDHEKAYNLLQLALYDIDRAGIFTIHGFCQRMLMEQALESGQLFDVELLKDIHHVRSEVTDDFWRNHIYSLEPAPCSIVLGAFASPEALLESVDSVFNAHGRIEPKVGSIETVSARLERVRALLAQWWALHSADLHSCFLEGIAQGGFKKGLSENFEKWFPVVEKFITGASHTIPESIELLSREHLSGELNGTKLRGEAKKNDFLEKFPLPDSDIGELISAIRSLLLTIRVQLAGRLRTEVSHRLEKQGTMGFNDLILGLSSALKKKRGQALKDVLSERFSVALIDEFQDTDSAQWHIFCTLFGGGQHLLYLIGDPKQAIYKFRGADIYSYFLARKSATKLLTLDTNYRSHPFLVEEVNRLFTGRQKPFYFDEAELDYQPVHAAKEVGEIDLLQAGRSLAGAAYCTLEPNTKDKRGRWTSGTAAERFRSFVVAESSRLLNSGVEVVVSADKERLLVPQDIAILVRSNRQADEYKQALAEANIPAVVGSQLSVYKTDECQELLLLLQAIAQPGDLVRMKTAMTIPWFNLTGHALQEIWKDDEQVSEYHARFNSYSQLWQEQGIMAMMSRLLVEERVFVNLASQQMAERSIANIQHLLELIQEQESATSLGIGQVLQWLLHMTKESGKGDEAELLLESDEEAVRIVTMHGAKGLEYSVVFCPYLWHSSRRTSQEKYQITSHDVDHENVVDLGSDRFEERKEVAVGEERAEDLRLLYVALTRAQIRCYIMWADVKASGSVADSFDSALGYLLFPEGYQEHENQQELFGRLERKESVNHQHISCDDETESFHQQKEISELRARTSSSRMLHTDWQMSSFSAMAVLSEYDNEQMTDVERVVDSGNIPVSGLPAGPHFGNVIHDLLETLSFDEIGSVENLEIQFEIVSQKCNRYGVDADLTHIQKLLKLVVTTPLRASYRQRDADFTLASLLDSKCLKEMGFYFHLSRLTTDRINIVLAGDPAVTTLSNKVMSGYLTGFVDLICEHNGKYYILDYKTNYLGELLEDYSPANLVAAMQSHNYGLQYWIYTLVLHRHMQNIIPGYSYRKHFGGVIYLFVRGMSPDIPGSGVFSTLPDYDTLLELDQVVGGDEND